MRLKKRKQLPRKFLHVMNRGARRLTIFADDRDRALFVRLLGKFALKHSVPIISWCLMPNHIHLEPDAEGAPLCNMMHDLQGTYSHAFNARHGTSGCVFQGPFVCTDIGDPRGLAYVSRYIHLNPSPLGVSPLSYKWSSCRSYLGSAWTPEWLNPNPVLTLFGADRASQIEGYRGYLLSPPVRRKRRKMKDEYGDFFMEYMRHLEEKFTERAIMVGPALPKTPLRTLVCWAARKIHEVPLRVVSQYFGYESENSVSVLLSRFEERLEGMPEVREILSR